MSKNLKIFLGISYLLILFGFLYFIFTNIQINRLNDFSYYKELQIDLGNYISANILINLIYFFIFSVVWVALLGFGSPILIISGVLFGKWIGTLTSVISISCGALILYSIGIFFFRDLIKAILEKAIEQKNITLPWAQEWLQLVNDMSPSFLKYDGEYLVPEESEEKFKEALKIIVNIWIKKKGFDMNLIKKNDEGQL